jgi:hypothetical protein
MFRLSVRYFVIVTALLGFPAFVEVGSAEQQSMLFGMSPGNYYPGGDLERDIKFYQLLQDAGVTHIGYGFNWDNIEKERGKYNWAPWDYVVDMAARFGIGVQGCIVGCPEWALPTSGDLGWLPVALNMPREECIPDFERFVTALAKRYAGKADHFEFWNEPNGYNMAPTVGTDDPRYQGKIEKYTRYLKIAYQAFKKGNPEGVFACGGIDSGGRTGVWLEGLYKNGAKGSMDAVAIHPYTNNPPYLDEEYILKTREIMNQHGDKDIPLWINEYGVYNPGEDLFRTVFDTVREKYPYVTLLTYHTFKDFYGGDGLQPWGVVDENLNIKSTGGYEAFKAYPKPARKSVPTAPTGPCRITGKITDLQLEKPLANCYVLAMPGVFYAKTDDAGSYSIDNLPEGTYSVSPRVSGFGSIDPASVRLTSSEKERNADFPLGRVIFPLGKGEAFDPEQDSADRIQGNIVVNGSFNEMQDTWVGQYGVDWHPFNTVKRMTYSAGAGVGGKGLSQKMGHSGDAICQGLYQVVPTVEGRKYRVTFWFTFEGQGPVADLNNCNRFGIDLEGGGWEHPNPDGGRPKYGFPETIDWVLFELAAKANGKSGGSGKAEKKWHKFTHDFVAEGPATSIWFEAAATQWEFSRKYFDEISVVPIEE